MLHTQNSKRKEPINTFTNRFFHKRRSSSIILASKKKSINRIKAIIPSLENLYTLSKKKQHQFNTTNFFKKSHSYFQLHHNRKLQHSITLQSKKYSKNLQNTIMRLNGLPQHILHKYFNIYTISRLNKFYKQKIQKLKRLKYLKKLRNHTTSRYVIRNILQNLPNYNHSLVVPGKTLTSYIQKHISLIFTKFHVRHLLFRKYVLSMKWNLEIIRTLARKHNRIDTKLHSLFTKHSTTPAPINVFWKTSLHKWFKLMEFYKNIQKIPQTELYIQSIKKKTIEHIHIVNFRFNQNKLRITLRENFSHEHHFFISPGLFIKYFNRRKSLKRSRPIKLLMMRFLRKILLIANLGTIGFRINGVPVDLDPLLTMLFKPLTHAFIDPISKKNINEVDPRVRTRTSKIIDPVFIQFDAIKAFGTHKSKKRGRIKRKIRRKLTKLVNLVD